MPAGKSKIIQQLHSSPQTHTRVLIYTKKEDYTYIKDTISPWSSHVETEYSYTGLMGSLVREEGHIYSLAAAGDLLYTGSDSKNIRVWKNQKEFSGFKSNSGLVKAIIIAGERIFSGHQDGKIRVWKISKKDPSVHKRIGTLPTTMRVSLSLPFFIFFKARQEKHSRREREKQNAE